MGDGVFNLRFSILEDLLKFGGEQRDNLALTYHPSSLLFGRLCLFNNL